MFHRFAESTRRIVFFARDQALASHQSLIEPSHLLLGLIRLHPELFEENLHSGDPVRVGCEIETRSEQPASGSKAADPRCSEELKRVLRNADDEAAALYKHKTGRRRRLLGFLTMNAWVVEPCHLLLGLLSESDCATAKTLVERGLTLQAARERFSQSGYRARNSP